MRRRNVFFKRQGMTIESFIEIVLLAALGFLLYPSLLSAMIHGKEDQLARYEKQCIQGAQLEASLCGNLNTLHQYVLRSASSEDGNQKLLVRTE